MKVHKEMFDRWEKYCRLYCYDRKAILSDIKNPVLAWNIATRLDIPREAYKCDLNDEHIETALRRIFPNAFPEREK